MEVLAEGHWWQEVRKLILFFWFGPELPEQSLWQNGFSDEAFSPREPFLCFKPKPRSQEHAGLQPVNRYGSEERRGREAEELSQGPHPG